MNRPLVAGQGTESLSLSDFELVRNAKGEWLCITSQAPAAFLDNPFLDTPAQTLSAQVLHGALVITCPAAKLQLQNILSSQYITAMQTDKPDALFFSVVDDDGSKQFSARIPILWE